MDKIGLDLDSLLCPRCGEVVETIDHALVTCSEVKLLWHLIGKWWKRALEEVNTIQDVLQVDNSNSRYGGRDEVWTAVTWCVMYFIWNHRYSLVFKKAKTNILDKAFEFQRITFEWISKRAKKWSISWENWLIDPDGALGIR